MKPRGFLESSIRSARTIAFIILPLMFLCWWLAWGLEDLRNSAIIISIIFAASFVLIFGVFGGVLDQEVKRDVNFLDRAGFMSDLEYSLSSLGFASSNSEGTYAQYKHRAQRVLVKIEDSLAILISTNGVLNSLKFPYTNALLLIKDQKFEEAIPLLEEVAEKRPELKPAQATLQEIYAKVDGDDSQYLKAQPISKKLMYLLWLAGDSRKLQEIIRYLEQNETVLVVMGDSSTQKEWEITRGDLKFALEVRPIELRAYALGQSGKYIQSLRYYKQALKLAPGCDLYHEHRFCLCNDRRKGKSLSLSKTGR